MYKVQRVYNFNVVLIIIIMKWFHTPKETETGHDNDLSTSMHL